MYNVVDFAEVGAVFVICALDFFKIDPCMHIT